MKTIFVMLIMAGAAIIGRFRKPSGVLTLLVDSADTFNADRVTANATVAAAGTVACNGDAGRITVTGCNAAAGAINSVTVTNNRFTTAADNLQLTIVGYTGTLSTDGEPAILYAQESAGQYIIHITNLHGTNALNGAVTIAYRVGKPIA